MTPIIRPVRPEDQGFVTAGFTKQLSDRNLPADSRMSSSEAGMVVDQVLDSKIVRILVAGDANDTRRIMGWIAYVPSFTHGRLIVYLYTRDSYRGHGVARALLDAAFPSRVGKMLHTFNGPDAKSLLTKFQSRHVKFEELIA